MGILNKKQAIKIIRESNNFQATIEYIQNSFTMNTKGNLMPKQENKVSLDSIYELVLNIKTEIKDMKTEIQDFKNETSKRFDLIDIEIKDIKDDINLIKSLPTISKELNSLTK